MRLFVSSYQDGRGSRDRRSRGSGMEMVPHRRNPPKSSMFTGLAATVKGKAASMQEDAKGKVSGCYVPLFRSTPLLHVQYLVCAL